MTTNAAKNNSVKRSPVIRITAAILAVIMISSVILYQNSGVKLNAEQFEEKGSRVAARELLKDDEYANASRIEQMTAFARNLLSGKHSEEDLELGIQISISQKNYEDAIALSVQLLEMFEGTDRELGRQYLRLGDLYVMTKDADNALKWLNAGIPLLPTAEAYLTRAQVYLEQGNAEAALADVNVCMNMTDGTGDLLADMVNIYEAVGQYEKAAGIYTELIERTGETEYLLNRAYCLTNLGRMEEAEADRGEYAKAGGKELGSADVMIGIGWMRAKEYAKADDAFVRAIDEQYAEPESLYYYVILCAYVTGNFERVCTYGEKVIERIAQGAEDTTADITVEKSTGRLNVSLVKMDRTSLYLMTGASHLYTGNYNRAAEFLTACLTENPELPYANYLRGASLMAAKRYEEAIADFDTTIAADEQTENSHFSRAVCRMQIGDKDGALEDYEWVVLNGKDETLFEEASQQIQRLLNEQDEQKEISGEE